MNMFTPRHSNSQSSMLRLAIVLIVLVVITGTIARYFNSMFDNVEQTQALTAVEAFASSVTNIHKNWILQGRPDKVVMQALNGGSNTGKKWVFVMNPQGWPINVIQGNDKPDCDALWVALQKSVRLSFSSVAVKMQRNEIGVLEALEGNFAQSFANDDSVWVCQIIVAQQLLFRYRLDTGNVEMD